MFGKYANNKCAAQKIFTCATNFQIRKENITQIKGIPTTPGH